jgi:hypothetical protein
VKLLLDEHYRPVIAEQLRRRGFDVIAVVETGAVDRGGMSGLHDLPLLRQATKEGRVLVTENARDFLRIHRELLARGETHQGIVLTSWRGYSRQRDAVGRLILALAEFMEAHESLSGQLVWL